jgi:hypothetical protein
MICMPLARGNGVTRGGYLASHDRDDMEDSELRPVTTRVIVTVTRTVGMAMSMGNDMEGFTSAKNNFTCHDLQFFYLPSALQFHL